MSPYAETLAVEVEVTTDNFPGETTWEIKDVGTGSVIASEGPYTLSGTTFTRQYEIGNTNQYQVSIRDSFGDGICCGNGLGSYVVKVDGVVVAAGSSFEYGASKLLNEPVLDHIVTVTLKTDNYPSEVSYSIASVSSGASVGSALGFSSSNTVYTEKYGIQNPGEYNFSIVEAWGDGICCTQGNGWYKIEVDGVKVTNGDGQYGSGENMMFTVL